MERKRRNEKERNKNNKWRLKGKERRENARKKNNGGDAYEVFTDVRHRMKKMNKKKKKRETVTKIQSQ